MSFSVFSELLYLIFGRNIMKISFSRFAFSMALSALCANASAQTIPGSVEPGQVQKRFEERPVQRPAQGGGVSITQDKPSAAPKQATEKDFKRFKLNQVAFEGVSVYQQADLEKLYSDLLGTEVSLAEVRSIADRLTQKYRADGYLIAQAYAPAQKIKGGAVTIRVVEGYVANITVEGQHEESGARNLVAQFADKVKASRPLRADVLERYLLLIDDLPGVTARGIIRPTGTQGAVNLVVLLEHKKFEASVNTNNRGTKFIGRNQHSATVAGNSVLGLYDRTLLRGITASPTEELRFFDIQHEEQIGSEGTKVILLGSYGRTEPGDVLKILDIRGKSESVGVQVRHPLLRSRKENLTVRGGLEYRDTETDILGTNFSDDSLRVARIGGSYDRSDSWDGVNFVDLELSQGFDVFGATDKGPGRSRLNGQADFTKVNLEASRTQSLPYNFSILAAFSGQYSFDSLLSPEQFALGGSVFGQAYDPSELTGDHGATAKLELRYGRAVNYQWFNSYQLYGYYDVGSVWQKNTLPGVEDKQSLASSGFGLRANFTPWLSGYAELAFPLTKNVSAEGDDDPRLFFSLTGRF